MKKLLREIRIFFHSLFFGMRGGDKEMLYSNTQSLNTDTHAEQEVETGTVYQDLLRGEITQQVKETRDSLYRVFREADKYLVEGDFSDNLDEFHVTAVKKTPKFYDTMHCSVYQEKGDSILLIQDQKEIDHDTETKEIEASEQRSIDGERIITCSYNSFTPSFDISKYLKKVIVFQSNRRFHKVDLYFGNYAGQFSKTDAIFLKKLKDCLLGNIKTFDALEIQSLEFITDKAFGSEDLFLYRFEDFKLLSIREFDGNLIVSYAAVPICDGIDLTEQYRTAEMDEKYRLNAPKSDTIDIRTIDGIY